MTLTIDLTPAEEARLTAAAAQAGLAPEEAARRLVTDHLPPAERLEKPLEEPPTVAALLRG